MGAATALEVIRILQALKPKPRRTIRIGLWSAEEQETLGSHACVAAHLGRKLSAAGDQPGRAHYEFKPEHEKFDAYFNFDYGTGRIRGHYLQGNEAARPIFRDLLEPEIAATDHMPFDEVGLPAFPMDTRLYGGQQHAGSSHEHGHLRPRPRRRPGAIRGWCGVAHLPSHDAR